MLNKTQSHLIKYMQEVCNQEDAYFLEAWKQVENFVLDSLSTEMEVTLPKEDEQGKISWISAVRAIEKVGGTVK